MASIGDQNYLIWNQGKNPLVNFNFMLRVEMAFDLPCKSVKAFTRELEYDYIQEGGLNDYVHMRRKPITKPFTLEIERYVGVDYVDPLPLGADLMLPLLLLVSRAHDQFIPFVVARTYVFTGCTVMKKTFGELTGDRSGLLVETTTIGYREMLCVDIPWSEVGDSIFGSVETPPTNAKNTEEEEGNRLKQEGRKAHAEALDMKKLADRFHPERIGTLIADLEAAIKTLNEGIEKDTAANLKAKLEEAEEKLQAEGLTAEAKAKLEAEIAEMKAEQKRLEDVADKTQKMNASIEKLKKLDVAALTQNKADCLEEYGLCAAANDTLQRLPDKPKAPLEAPCKETKDHSAKAIEAGKPLKEPSAAIEEGEALLASTRSSKAKPGGNVEKVPERKREEKPKEGGNVEKVPERKREEKPKEGGNVERVPEREKTEEQEGSQLKQEGRKAHDDALAVKKTADRFDPDRVSALMAELEGLLAGLEEDSEPAVQMKASREELAKLDVTTLAKNKADCLEQYALCAAANTLLQSLPDKPKADLEKPAADTKDYSAKAITAGEPLKEPTAAIEEAEAVLKANRGSDAKPGGNVERVPERQREEKPKEGGNVERVPERQREEKPKEDGNVAKVPEREMTEEQQGNQLKMEGKDAWNEALQVKKAADRFDPAQIAALMGQLEAEMNALQGLMDGAGADADVSRAESAYQGLKSSLQALQGLDAQQLAADKANALEQYQLCDAANDKLQGLPDKPKEDLEQPNADTKQYAEATVKAGEAMMDAQADMEAAADALKAAKEAAAGLEEAQA